MHTVTSKTILSPLAEAVFQLILTISEAQISKSPIPDLSQLAKVVDAQIINLVTVGTKIQNQASADEKIKAEMPIAANEVTKASQGLVTGTTELSSNPYSKEGQLQLLESVKGILSGTTNVLFTFDNFEIRKIINIANQCIQNCLKMSTDLTMTPQQLVQVLMQTSQVVVQLAQVANKRIGELLSPGLRQRLKVAVGDLSRESPLLISSSKAFLQGGVGNGKAREARDLACGRLAEVCVEIKIVVQMNQDDDFAFSFDKKFERLQFGLAEQADAIVDTLKAKDVKTAKEAYEKYLETNGLLKNAALDYTKNSNDPTVKKNIENLLRDINDAERKVADLIKDLSADPTNTKKIAELQDLLRANDKNWLQVADIHQKDKKNLDSLKKEVEETGNNLINAAKSGTPEEIKSTLAKYEEGANAFKNLAKAISKKATSSLHKQKITDAIKEEEEIESEISKLSNDLSTPTPTPNPTKTLKKLENAITKKATKSRDKVSSELNKSLIADILEAALTLSDRHKPETDLGALFKTATDSDPSQKDKLASKVDQFKKRKSSLCSILGEAIAIARTTNPQLASDLQRASNRLDELGPAITNVVEALYANPKDEVVKELANGMLGSWEENVKNIIAGTVGQEGVFSSKDIINGLQDAFEKKVEEFSRAVFEKDAVDGDRCTGNVVETANQFLGVARRELENTSDEVYRAELVERIYHVEQAIKTLGELNKKMMIDFTALGSFPDDDSSDLLNAIRSLTEKMKSLGFNIRKNNGDETNVPIKEMEEEIATPAVIVDIPEAVKIEEVVVVVEEKPEMEVIVEDPTVEVVMEEAPKLFTAAEATANPIMAVAQELKVELSQWATAGNPVTSAASEITNSLQSLSFFHLELKHKATPEAKKGFINAAKDIVSHSKNFINPVKEIAARCTDMRLRKVLLGTLERIDTLSQQLKIVAAVKASSPGDTDRDQQLIMAAQNLMVAIKSGLKECESITSSKKMSAVADLKGMTPSEVTFRRKVYRGVAIPEH